MFISNYCRHYHVYDPCLLLIIVVIIHVYEPSLWVIIVGIIHAYDPCLLVIIVGIIHVYDPYSNDFTLKLNTHKMYITS